MGSRVPLRKIFGRRHLIAWVAEIRVFCSSMLHAAKAAARLPHSKLRTSGIAAAEFGGQSCDLRAGVFQ
jgi:hypothetical protein